MTRIIAIDPGTTQSAWLLLAGGVPIQFAIAPNDEVLAMLRRLEAGDADVVVVEQFESYGMAVGREVFETVRWAGRFEEAAAPVTVALLPRRAVKLAICSSPKANDANIRAALLDRYGGKAAGRVGGPLAGIVKDLWSALALAITFAEGER
jgi:hypothetical protein